jgi:archaemetzincin
LNLQGNFCVELLSKEPMATDHRFLVHRRQVLHALGALGLTLTASATHALEASIPVKSLVLQPLGHGLADEAVTTVRKALLAFYRLEVKSLPPVGLPRSAFYPPRQRYRAERLLRFLERRAAADAYRIVGVTAVDISTTKGKYHDWGILGLATIDGRTCVLSAFRCKRGTSREAQVQDRLGKVAVHEVGHTLGLNHCPTYGCLMEDARGTVMTTDREYDLCQRCRKKLQRMGHAARTDSTPPWPRPR